MSEGSIIPNLNYIKNVECRWLLPGDILWFLNSPESGKNIKNFIWSTTNDDVLSLSDPGPTFGFFVAMMRYIFDKEMWNFILRKPIE